MGTPKRIIPWAVSSFLGVRWLQLIKYMPDLIYLDSSHEIDETYMELVQFWDILAPGGIMMGDDYNWPGVTADVNKFCKDRNLEVKLFGYRQNWYIQKATTDTAFVWDSP